MDLKGFFEHWHIRENPFQAEEAKNDEVYLQNLAEAMTHPDFDKVFGSPREVSTSVVFGKKGSGKTAMRVLMEKRYGDHNQAHPDDQVRVIRYDDLNPVLDRVAQREASKHSGKSGPKSLPKLRLVDHQDAILSIGVTDLVDEVLADNGRQAAQHIRKMPRQSRFDLALLATLYDQPVYGDGGSRLARLRSLTRVAPFWRPNRLLALAALAAATLIGALLFYGTPPEEFAGWLVTIAAAVVLVLALGGFLIGFFKRSGLGRRLRREVRTNTRAAADWRQLLAYFGGRDLSLSPLPRGDDQESRYELTQRFQRLLRNWGYRKMVVLIDRVDEPQFVNSDPKKMRDLIWPMLNNKFLQQESFALKFLLPAELGDLLRREDADFFNEARLDKQNLIGRLEWTGATLYDVCTRRLKACQDADAEKITGVSDLFDDDVSSTAIINALDHMKQPRDAFKFLYQVIQEHCLDHPDDEPVYHIPALVLNKIRKNQTRRLEDLDMGVSPA